MVGPHPSSFEVPPCGASFSSCRSNSMPAELIDEPLAICDVFLSKESLGGAAETARKVLPSDDGRRTWAGRLERCAFCFFVRLSRFVSNFGRPGEHCDGVIYMDVVQDEQ